MKIYKNIKYCNDYESLCLNDYFIIENLNKNKERLNSFYEDGKFINRKKRTSSTLSVKKTHSNILNSLQHNAKRSNIRKKTYNYS